MQRPIWVALAAAALLAGTAGLVVRAVRRRRLPVPLARRHAERARRLRPRERGQRRLRRRHQQSHARSRRLQQHHRRRRHRRSPQVTGRPRLLRRLLALAPRVGVPQFHRQRRPADRADDDLRACPAHGERATQPRRARSIDRAPGVDPEPRRPLRGSRRWSDALSVQAGRRLRELRHERGVSRPSSTPTDGRWSRRGWPAWTTTSRPQFGVSLDARYLHARGELGPSFQGYDRIDLSGMTATVGLSFRL